jgi:hypothetical protein
MHVEYAWDFMGYRMRIAYYTCLAMYMGMCFVEGSKERSRVR